MLPRPTASHASTPVEATTIDLSGSCTGHTYLLVEPIGGGGTGRVWRAVDRASGRQVAVKLLHRDLMCEPKAVTRFVQEREILLMLRHRNVVRVRDLLTIGDSLGLVMDLVTGGSLRQHLRSQRTLRPAAAAGMLAQIADALAHAHRLGIVHRDLKPDNILIDPSPPSDRAAPGGDHGETGGGAAAGEHGGAAPAGPHVRLTDFGIARLLDEPGITTPHALVGTPNYLAPEVITGGAATPAVDVYALGILLYELLLGRPPYAGGPVMAVLRRHVDTELPRHPGIPDEAWRVITACTAKDPDRRPTAEALVATMRSLARRTAGEPAAPLVLSVPADAAASGDATDPRAADDDAVAGPDAAAGPDAGGDVPAAAAPGTGEPGESPDAAEAGGPSDAACPARGVRQTGTRPHRARHSRRRRWRPALLTVAAAAVLAMMGSGTVSLPDWFSTAQRQGTATPAAPAVPGPAPGETRGGTSQAARPSAGPTPAAPTATATPAPEPSARPARRARKVPRVGAKARVEVYGPLQCTKKYVWDVGHPAVARPCHAEGPAIRLVGRLQALPGVRTDVTLTLVDADTGRPVGRPFTCRGLTFTDFSREQTCGPFQVGGAQRGHRYVVVQRWRYTGRTTLPPGSARSAPFVW